MTSKPTTPDSAQGVDLDAVQKLVSTLEVDLSRLRDGSGDVQSLRDEVDALKDLLSSPSPPHPPVRQALHGVRNALDREWGSAKTEAFVASRYVAEIGRILGL
ncbi:MAG TPA: hypothetical protein VGP15_06265 [Burkholderiales bacterium]|jgi:hypothetical protein|nr:hypothetical protein [Burkholderiales bacterium]